MLKYTIFTVNPVQENSYLLWDDETKEACIVDPGFCFPNEEHAFRDALAYNGLKLVRCIHTHLHFDHMLGASFITSEYGIPAEASPRDIIDLPHLTERLLGSNHPFSARIKNATFQKLPDTGTLTFGKTTLHILSVPGHTLGHVAFYAPKDNLVLTGDVLFKGDIGRTDLYGGNYEQLISSIKEQLFMLPAETVVLPGHGDSTTIGIERDYFRYK